MGRKIYLLGGDKAFVTALALELCANGEEVGFGMEGAEIADIVVFIDGEKLVSIGKVQKLYVEKRTVSEAVELISKA